MKRFAVLGLLLLASIASVGCRPYDVPEFAEVQHHESAYLIPLEGASKAEQTKFESAEALEKNKVAIKRLQILHRWVQTGRLYFWGYYMDLVRLVVVDRTPVTREWTASTTAGGTDKSQAIWLESKDSIGFSLGFNCTAFIDEPDSSKFLYWYPTTKKSEQGDQGFDKSVAGLAHVMDSEIRARVVMLGNTISVKYDLDDLRARKYEILNAIRNGVPEEKDATGKVVQEKLQGVIEHFHSRGITITNLGQFGGFEYEDPKIQTAINETFVAQQEKVKTEAAFDAQQRKNDRIQLEAEAEAGKARVIAQGTADAVKIAAEAQAGAVRAVAAATKEAGKDPLFIQLKQLEVETSRITKWNGQYPSTLMSLGGEGGPDLLLNLPAAAAVPATK